MPLGMHDLLVNINLDLQVIQLSLSLIVRLHRMSRARTCSTVSSTDSAWRACFGHIDDQPGFVEFVGVGLLLFSFIIAFDVDFAAAAHACNDDIEYYVCIATCALRLT